ncbi:sugar ABC transporter substrate-binding protein [Phytomonospora sp. NPDC050363]|uniref:sugar ABC transporter substrate-binding protein n=1 Tax=Phytomonospora sp. NPDC050363 TaxID=3155642 RepID=UPI0033DE4BCF
MRGWIRPVAALGLATAMLAVAACGRDADGTQNEGPGTAVGAGPATGEINIWAMGAEGEKLSALIEGFTKDNPEATVKVTPIPWDGAHDKISTAITAGETPDVALIGTTWMGEFARTGGLDPTPEDLIKPADFYPGAWDTTVVDGTSYGVPWYVETRLFYVNKEVAGKAGITAPPTTWEDLKAAFAAMQDKGGAKWGVSLQPGATGSWQSVMPFVWQNGGTVQKEDGSFDFDSPESVAALEYYKSFFSEGLSPSDLPQGSLEPEFVKGDIGAFVSGPWHIGILEEQGAAGEYELWGMPTKQSATSFVGGGDLAVFKDAANREGAWKFVSYLSRPDVQATWFQTVGDLPSVKSAWDDPALKENPLLSAFGTQLNDAKSPPTISTWDQVAAVFDDKMEALIKTGMTPAEAAAAIQEEATSIGTGA